MARRARTGVDLGLSGPTKSIGVLLLSIKIMIMTSMQLPRPPTQQFRCHGRENEPPESRPDSYRLVSEPLDELYQCSLYDHPPPVRLAKARDGTSEIGARLLLVAPKNKCNGEHQRRAKFYAKLAH